MASLEYFFASGNKFDQDYFPEFLQTLPLLKEIGLKSTNRFGNIPTWIGTLVNLALLDVDNNQMFGALPTELGLLNKLEFLLLNRNQFSGEIPAEFSGLTALRMVFLDNNNLVGNVAELCRLPTFQLPRPFPDLEGRELITADCGGTVPQIVCGCCTSCCSDDDPNCNTNTEIPNLDPTWEASYNRIYFKFGDKKAYFSSAEIP
jgi:hypothetical protein